MKFDVKKIAKLANLTLTHDEESKFDSQLTSILGYVEQLNKVDISSVEPTSQVTGLENVTRDDNPGKSLTQEEALSGTKSTKDRMFKVKAVIESQ